jgi:DNA-binding NtrC family response regulator
MAYIIGATDVGMSTVLVVEDEPLIGELIRIAVTSLPCTVLLAKSAAEALQVCASQPRNIDVMLADLTLPDSSAGEFFPHIVKLQPGIRILIVSGHQDDDIRLIPDLATYPVISKPFDLAMLVRRIRDIIEQ